MSRHLRHPKETPQILCILRMEKYLWGAPEYSWGVPEYPWGVPEYPWGVPDHPWVSLGGPGGPWESVEKIFKIIYFLLSQPLMLIFIFFVYLFIIQVSLINILITDGCCAYCSLLIIVLFIWCFSA